MTDLSTIGEKLDALAVAMLEEAAKEATTLDRKLDTFKFVQQYYVSARKLRPGGGSSDTDTPTMEQLRNQVAAGAGATPEPEGESEDVETDAD